MSGVGNPEGIVLPATDREHREQQTVLAILHEPHFVDLAPPQVYAQLLEEG